MLTSDPAPGAELTGETRRELLGICKQNMLQLRLSLGSYVAFVHRNESSNHDDDFNAIMCAALQELCDGSPVLPHHSAGSSGSSQQLPASDEPMALSELCEHNKLSSVEPFDDGYDALPAHTAAADHSRATPQPWLMQHHRDQNGAVRIVQQSASGSVEETVDSGDDDLRPVAGDHNACTPAKAIEDAFSQRQRGGAAVDVLAQAHMLNALLQHSISSTGSPQQQLNEHDDQLPQSSAALDSTYLTTSPGNFNRDAFCSLCDRTFNTKASFLRHNRQFHASNVKKYKCLWCSHNSYRKDNLQKHVKRVHFNNDPMPIEFAVEIDVATGDPSFVCDSGDDDSLSPTKRLKIISRQRLSRADERQMLGQATSPEPEQQPNSMVVLSAGHS